MIDMNAFAEAARNNDAYVEEYGIEAWMERHGIEPEALSYITEQRALRAAMMLSGDDPTKLSRTEMTRVQLSDEAQELMPILQAVALDGIAIGVSAKTNEEE